MTSSSFWFFSSSSAGSHSGILAGDEVPTLRSPSAVRTPLCSGRRPPPYFPSGQLLRGHVVTVVRRGEGSEAGRFRSVGSTVLSGVSSTTASSLRVTSTSRIRTAARPPVTPTPTDGTVRDPSRPVGVPRVGPETPRRDSLTGPPSTAVATHGLRPSPTITSPTVGPSGGDPDPVAPGNGGPLRPSPSGPGPVGGPCPSVGRSTHPGHGCPKTRQAPPDPVSGPGQVRPTTTTVSTGPEPPDEVPVVGAPPRRVGDGGRGTQSVGGVV